MNGNRPEQKHSKDLAIVVNSALQHLASTCIITHTNAGAQSLILT